MSKAKIGEDLWKNRVEKVVLSVDRWCADERMRNCLC